MSDPSTRFGLFKRYLLTCNRWHFRLYFLDLGKIGIIYFTLYQNTAYLSHWYILFQKKYSIRVQWKNTKFKTKKILMLNIRFKKQFPSTIPKYLWKTFDKCKKKDNSFVQLWGSLSETAKLKERFSSSLITHFCCLSPLGACYYNHWDIAWK